MTRPRRARRRRHRRAYVPGAGAGRARCSARGRVVISPDRRARRPLRAARDAAPGDPGRQPVGPAAPAPRRARPDRRSGSIQARRCCAALHPAAVARVRRLSLGAGRAGRRQARHSAADPRAERGARPRQPAAGAPRRAAGAGFAATDGAADGAPRRAPPYRQSGARRGRRRRAEPYRRRERDGADRVLVIGGSQGARIFAEIVPAALARCPSLRARRCGSASRPARGSRARRAAPMPARHRGRGRELLRRHARAPGPRASW